MELYAKKHEYLIIHPNQIIPPEHSLRKWVHFLPPTMEINVIHTPGHTPGCSCFLIEENLFSGDTLFRFGIGRTDLPDSSPKDIMSSIKDRLFSLPEGTKVWTGHGKPTNIKQEKRLPQNDSLFCLVYNL